MHRPHPTTDSRLACLTEEELARAEASSSQELADAMEALKHANDLRLNEVGQNNRMVKALGVILGRKLRAEDAGSIVARREDGSEMVWTAQSDGTGFRRQRLARPRVLDQAPAKPDAGAG